MLEPGNGEWSHSLYTVLSLNLRYYRGSSLHQRERERERPRSAHNLLIPALLMPPLLFSAAAASTLPQSSLYSLRACFERAHTPPRPPARKSRYTLSNARPFFSLFLPLSPPHRLASLGILIFSLRFHSFEEEGALPSGK